MRWNKNNNSRGAELLSEMAAALAEGKGFGLLKLSVCNVLALRRCVTAARLHPLNRSERVQSLRESISTLHFLFLSISKDTQNQI